MTYSFEQAIEVFDDWWGTLIPGEQTLEPLHKLNPRLEEWSVGQWREALQDLLGRYAQMQVEGSSPEVNQALEQLEVIRKMGLPSAMQGLLRDPYYDIFPECRVTKIRVILRALDLLERYELTEEETTQLEEFNEWKPWRWKGVNQLGEIEVNDYNTLLVEGGIGEHTRY